MVGARGVMSTGNSYRVQLHHSSRAATSRWARCNDLRTPANNTAAHRMRVILYVTAISRNDPMGSRGCDRLLIILFLRNVAPRGVPRSTSVPLFPVTVGFEICRTSLATIESQSCRRRSTTNGTRRTQDLLRPQTGFVDHETKRSGRRRDAAVHEIVGCVIKTPSETESGHVLSRPTAARRQRRIPRKK